MFVGVYRTSATRVPLAPSRDTFVLCITKVTWLHDPRCFHDRHLSTVRRDFLGKREKLDLSDVAASSDAVRSIGGEIGQVVVNRGRSAVTLSV